MLARLGRAGGRDAILSSEDFESSLTFPDRWLPLIKGAAAIGYHVTFVVYLRDPADYLDSLFTENVKHGCSAEFALVASEAVQTGLYRFHEWVFCFNYDLIARSLAKLPDASVVFRSFEHLEAGSIVHDFFAVIGKTVPPDMENAARNVYNERVPPEQNLYMFVRNRPGYHDEHRKALVPILGEMTGHRKMFARLPDSVRTAFGDALASRTKVDSDAGRVRARRVREPKPGEWLINLSRMFSWETTVMVGDLYDATPGTGLEEKLATLRAAPSRQIEEWRDWVSSGF